MVQKISAMGEDTKYQIIFQDLIRRLMNTSESLEPKYKIEVVDEYCDKLVRCGYSKDQVSRILINGITGYGRKRKRMKQEGRKLKTRSKENRMKRFRDKLLKSS